MMTHFRFERLCDAGGETAATGVLLSGALVADGLSFISME
jgi:hypothetical protein